MTIAEGWFLYRGEGTEAEKPATLVREVFELPPCAPDQIVAEPIYGCWEGNMSHGIARKPIDVCRHRGEAKVIMGNAGVVRIREVGRDVKRFEPGQRAIIFSASVLDEYGYPEKIFGYDASGTMGCLATRILVREHELLAIPEGTRHALGQWAAFSVRYITAWANLEMALAVFHAMVSENECASPHVWGWGGGTTLAELDLAARRGCKSVMLSGNDTRLAAIRATGVEGIDRRKFGQLHFDEARFYSDLGYRREYSRSESAFVEEVRARTGGKGVDVFVDYIGSPVHRATLKAIGRVGVIATAGWKEGMVISLLRASECIDRRQYVHTHYARYAQGLAAVQYAENTGWLPQIDEPISAFDEIPALCERFDTGITGFFPLYAVNPE